ncbi:MAG TPA: NAD(P)/FAD-dependent oxidoreductase, partial [Tepidisphaeraceae bacterium]
MNGHGEFEAEVLVLGAGAAGLLAARELSKDRKVIVIEAQNRVGGRIESLQIGNDPLPVELGPEFIHGHVAETFAILRESNLIAIDLPDTHVDVDQGKFIDSAQDWDVAIDVVERLNHYSGEDCSFAEFLSRQENVPQPARDKAIAFVEGYNAARQGDISALALGEAGRAEGASDSASRQFHLSGRYDRLTDTLSASIPLPSHVILNTRVRAIEWQPGDVKVRVTGPNGDAVYSAPAVVIALPLGALQSDAITFTPELPTRAALREALAMGPVVKVIVRFPDPFWEKHSFDLSFLHDASAAFPTWWTTLPRRTGQLTGWCGGAAADRLPEDEHAIRQAAIDSLSRIFGRDGKEIEADIEQFWMKDWRSDTAGGAYSYVRVGGIEAANKLADPIENTLFMAGEHTHVALIGTVAGALASAHRVVEQVRDR